MSILNLKYWDDPALSAVCPKVDDNEFGPKLAEFGQDLIATMEAKGGIGLAAPQVGVLKRVFAMRFPDDESLEPVVVCNPSLRLEGEAWREREGCLSLPGVFEQVARARNVVMQYSSPDGTMYETLLRDWNAKVAQHEADHLDGIMFFDYTDKRPAYGARMSRQMHKQVMRAWDKERAKRGL